MCAPRRRRPSWHARGRRLARRSAMAMEREALDMAPGVDVDDGCHSPFAARQRLRMLSRHLNPPHVSAAAAAAAGAAGAALSGKVKLVVGANNFGGRLTDVAAALTAMRRHGVHELDVARAYVGGEAEVSVGVALAATAAGADAGAESPVAVTGGGPMLATKTHFNQLGFRRVKEDMAKSLAALGRDKVDIYYIHSPDGSATLTETLQAVNELHSEGKFDRLGISNFPAWQLMMIIQLSKERGWLLPSVYQGAYSVIQRHAEVELLPLCRAHGISYYAYSPLARGILTGKHGASQMGPMTRHARSLLQL
eukprot:COSAG01_NODE_10276_length_2203_cov_7.852186_1_plen_309_part_00